MTLLLLFILSFGFSSGDNPRILKVKEIDFCPYPGKEAFSLRATESLAQANDSITFEILGEDGKRLYFDRFPSIALIDLGYSEDISKLEYIQSRIRSFFSEDQFKNLSSLPNFDSDYSDQESWECVHSSKGEKYFSYKLYQEWTKLIGYCSKQQKIIVFWQCC